MSHDYPKAMLMLIVDLESTYVQGWFYFPPVPKLTVGVFRSYWRRARFDVPITTGSKVGFGNLYIVLIKKTINIF